METSTNTSTKNYNLEPLKRQIDWDKERLAELKAETNATLLAKAKQVNSTAIDGLQETIDRRKKMLADMKAGLPPTEEYFHIGGQVIEE